MRCHVLYSGDGLPFRHLLLPWVVFVSRLRSLCRHLQERTLPFRRFDPLVSICVPQSQRQIQYARDPMFAVRAMTVSRPNRLPRTSTKLLPPCGMTDSFRDNIAQTEAEVYHRRRQLRPPNTHQRGCNRDHDCLVLRSDGNRLREPAQGSDDSRYGRH